MTNSPKPHEYKAGYSGMCCDEMVLDADGCGDSCGKDFDDPIHRVEKLCLVCKGGDSAKNPMRRWREPDGEGLLIHYACMTPEHHQAEEYRRSFFGLTREAYQTWLENPKAAMPATTKDAPTGDYMFPGLPKPAPVLPAAYITSLMGGRKPGFMEQYLTDRRAALDVPEPPTEPYKWLPDNLETESAVVDKPFEGFMLGGQVWTPTTLAQYMISGAHYSYSLTTRPFKRSDVTDLMVVQACADVKASREYAEKMRSKYDLFAHRDTKGPYEMLRIRYPRIPRKVILAAMRRTEDREFIESGVSIEQAWITKAGEMYLETEPLRQEIRNLKSQLAVYKKGFK